MHMIIQGCMCTLHMCHCLYIQTTATVTHIAKLVNVYGIMINTLNSMKFDKIEFSQIQCTYHTCIHKHKFLNSSYRGQNYVQIEGPMIWLVVQLLVYGKRY